MTKNYLVFDIGGTSIKYGLIDEQLQLSNTGSCRTLHNADGHILKMLKQLSRDYINNYEVAGIGVSTAGIVGADGAIQYAGPTITDYQGTPIKAELAQLTGLPVFVVNDVDACLLGEQLAGSAQDASSAYCIALGTGIGGAYLANGQLLSGAHGTANSIGYTLYDPQTKTNYEQRASTLTLDRELVKYKISVKDAFEAAKQGNQQYLTIIDDWTATVAAGLAQIMLLFDPEVLVIGGAVSQQGSFLLDLLQKNIDKLIPKNLCRTRLEVTVLADKAQLFGAASGLMQKK